MRVRAVDGSSETHLIYFPSDAAYEAYRRNPERLLAQDFWRASGAVSIAQEVEAISLPMSLTS
jgi:hypothetical protein